MNNLITDKEGDRISEMDRTSKRGTLVLEDGSSFPGILFGFSGTPVLEGKATGFGYGEVVFNTSMTGYQEILTDPSYFGQIVCMTVPHIGNTGVNTEDPESSRCWCSGFIIHEISELSSSWRSEEDLDAYLKKNKIPALRGVDTRALTRHLRSKGVVRGIILPEEERDQAEFHLASLPRFEGRDLIQSVTTPEPYRWEKPPSGTDSFRVVAVDFGIKWNLLRSLQKLGCDLEVVPATTSAEEILSRKPAGVFLSNGPGDPSAAPYAVETVKALLGKIPIFGVCMGHQILAIACGAKTYKLKFGHRGGNQPVLDQTTHQVEISSHNHGYAVDMQTLPPSLEITHMNLNDKTVEGLRVKNLNAFSVQYHPEACPGPHDSAGLFEQFVKNMKAHVSKIS